MDYFNDVLTMFLDVDRVNYIAVYGGSELSEFIKNILIYVPKMNEGLVTWGWVNNDYLHFWVIYPFKSSFFFFF